METRAGKAAAHAVMAAMVGAFMLGAAVAEAQWIALFDIDARIDGVSQTLGEVKAITEATDLAVTDGAIPIDGCRRISQPGSYVLNRNITSVPRGDCLTVAVNHVTIDLRGSASPAAAPAPVWTTSNPATRTTTRTWSMSPSSTGR